MARQKNAERVERDEREHLDGNGSAASRLPRWLLRGIVVGAVLWLVGAAVFYTAVIGVVTPRNPGKWVLWFQAALIIGQALCVGSAATLIGLLMIRRWDSTPPR